MLIRVRISDGIAGSDAFAVAFDQRRFARRGPFEPRKVNNFTVLLIGKRTEDDSFHAAFFENSLKGAEEFFHFYVVAAGFSFTADPSGKCDFDLTVFFTNLEFELICIVLIFQRIIIIYLGFNVVLDSLFLIGIATRIGRRQNCLRSIARNSII